MVFFHSYVKLPEGNGAHVEFISAAIVQGILLDS